MEASPLPVVVLPGSPVGVVAKVNHPETEVGSISSLKERLNSKPNFMAWRPLIQEKLSITWCPSLGHCMRSWLAAPRPLNPAGAHVGKALSGTPVKPSFEG